MMNALWVSKTGLSAQDTQLATVSHNLANVSTVGFKRDRVVFEDLLYQIRRQPGAQSSENNQLPSGLQIGTGVRIVGTQKEFTEGSLQVTGNSLDVAINGRGFLEVLMPDGTTAYTRNGEFHLSRDGELVNADGLVIQPAITIPEGARTVTIGKDGVVSVVLAGDPQAQQIGSLTLTDFINPAGLEAIGGNLFLETTASGSPTNGTPGLDGLGTIEQGSLENSNVDVVEELVNMITTQRAYEMNAKVIAASDQMLQFISQNL
ncbi:MAG: flagellar basal-body rod protein FlgG [Pseudomonadales bacterium]|jgi:flagellar basal-body rod protein FlgG|nr:flagellar basal-body rod protein FlgG [Pseudomonadales bacterium]MCP5320811.1 flagellar basal-body rod protein FlgG [Pseudomonadales bacterium]MCP5337610.1 flagellar basal-body rod protein FlgG [Pseudomonadales bacterium]